MIYAWVFSIKAGGKYIKTGGLRRMRKDKEIYRKGGCGKAEGWAPGNCLQRKAERPIPFFMTAFGLYILW